MPNFDAIRDFTPQILADRLRTGIQLICDKATTRGVTIRPDEFATHSLVAPACGLGSTTIDIAEEVFTKLSEMGLILQKG